MDERLGREGAAPADRDVRDLSAVLAGRRPARARAIPTTSCSPADRSGGWLAETIRDSALAASGLLNRTIGGPSVKPYQPAGLWEQSGTGKTYKQDTGAQALSPQPLHVLAAHVAAAVDGHLRRDVARGLHGEARRDDHAAAVAGAAERSAVRRSGAPARGATRCRRFPARRRRRATRLVFRALIGRAPDDDRAEILARLFDEQRASVRPAHRTTPTRLLGVGESRGRHGARPRRPGGA